MKQNKVRFVALLWTALVLLLLLFIADIALGAVYISPSEMWQLLSQQVDLGSKNFILLDFRIPKAITALVAGAAISVSGLLMQTYFRNPLAGPFVLGISSGGSLGVAFLVMAGSFFAPLLALGQWGVVLASLFGSALVLLAVLAVASRIHQGASLLIVGLMFGSFTGAMVSMLEYFSQAELVQRYLFWTFGSLNGVGWEELAIMLPFLISALVLAFFQQKKLNLLLLGEAYAQSMGLNLKQTRYLLVLCTCILAGVVTAFCGPIAFLGMAVPHLARLVLKNANHAQLIPLTAVMGSCLLLFCDVLCQLPGKESNLPINAISSLIGAPVVLMVLLKAKKGGAFT